MRKKKIQNNNKSFKEIGIEVRQKTESIKKTFYRYKHLLLINEDYFITTKETRGGTQKCICLSNKAVDFLFNNRKGRLFENSFKSMLNTVFKDVLEFENQKRIGDYFFDFYCSELNLFIEYDEAQHQFIHQKNKDYSKSKMVTNLIRIKKGQEYAGLNLIIKVMISKLKKPKMEESILEKAFADIMPEVKFIDATPKARSVAGRTRKDIEKQTGKKVISKGNFKNQKLLKGSKKK